MCSHNIARFEGRILPRNNFSPRIQCRQRARRNLSSNVYDPSGCNCSRKATTWHGHLWPGCSLRMTKRFRISWMHASSKLALLFLRQQWFHGHASTLLVSSPNIQMVGISRALCPRNLYCQEVHSNFWFNFWFQGAEFFIPFLQTFLSSFPWKCRGHHMGQSIRPNLVVCASSQAHQHIVVGTMSEFGLLCSVVCTLIRRTNRWYQAKCETRQGQEGELPFHRQICSQVVCNNFTMATTKDFFQI